MGCFEMEGRFGGRNMPQQAGQTKKKGTCTVERAHLLFNRLCLRQWCCQPHSRKHHFLPPTALPLLQTSLQHLITLPCWSSAGLSCSCWGEAAACHCSHFREKVNGCRKRKGRDRRTLNWQGAHERSETRCWYSQYAILRAGMASQPCLQECCLQRLGNNVFLTSPAFSAWTNLVAGHPVTYL